MSDAIKSICFFSGLVLCGLLISHFSEMPILKKPKAEFNLKDAIATGEQVKVFNGDSVGTGTVFEKNGRLYVLSNRFVMSPVIEWADGSKSILEIGDPEMDWVMLPVMKSMSGDE